MDLYLIRHAQSANNAVAEKYRVADPALTDLGQRQADFLAEAAADLGLTRLISSPFRRTLQTANALHQVTGLLPQVRSELHEQGGCYSGYEEVGRVGQPGMTRTEIEDEFKFHVADDIDEDGWWKCRDYEPWQAAQRRAAEVVRGLREEFGHTQERIALIIHADFKSLILNELQKSYLSTPYNASLSHVRKEDDDLKLIDFNRVVHLPDELLTF